MLTSFGAMMWLGVSSQIAKSRGAGHNQLKVLRTDNFPFNLTLDSQIKY